MHHGDIVPMSLENEVSNAFVIKFKPPSGSIWASSLGFGIRGPGYLLTCVNFISGQKPRQHFIIQAVDLLNS